VSPTRAFVGFPWDSRLDRTSEWCLEHQTKGTDVAERELWLHSVIDFHSSTPQSRSASIVRKESLSRRARRRANARWRAPASPGSFCSIASRVWAVSRYKRLAWSVITDAPRTLPRYIVTSPTTVPGAMVRKPNTVSFGSGQNGGQLSRFKKVHVG
jgi:hypothetical protein